MSALEESSSYKVPQPRDTRDEFRILLPIEGSDSASHTGVCEQSSYQYGDAGSGRVPGGVFRRGL